MAFGRWQSWHLACKIGTMSLMNVGALADCVVPAVSPAIRNALAESTLRDSRIADWNLTLDVTILLLLVESVYLPLRWKSMPWPALQIKTAASEEAAVSQRTIRTTGCQPQPRRCGGQPSDGRRRARACGQRPTC